MARIGIFSGTFDPVHAGHVAFAQAALAACRLDRVVFAPEANPRAKPQVAPLEHRVAMLELALEGKADLSVLQLESIQFSVQQTLPELRALFPNDELTLLVGSDVVETFAYRWPGLDDLLQAMDLAVGLRTGADQAAVTKQLQAVQARFQLVESPHPHAASEPIRGAQLLVHAIPAVTAYAERFRLYPTAATMSRQ